MYTSLRDRAVSALKKKLINALVVKEESYPVPSFDRVDIQKGCIISPDSIIGKYTYIGFNTNITKSVIGNYCSIASLVSIGDGEHPLDDISTNSIFYEQSYATLTQKDCIIGNDVWIGTQSVIRRGVKIGDGAVVGANSFVNKDVPDFAVVAGSPARIIKYRFVEKIRSVIKESKWWELDIEYARKKIIKLRQLAVN